MVTCRYWLVNVATHDGARAGVGALGVVEARAGEDADDLRNVATISTSGDADMGNIVATAFDKVGSTGSTVIEESQTLNDEIDFTEGLTVDPDAAGRQRALYLEVEENESKLNMVLKEHDQSKDRKSNV